MTIKITNSENDSLSFSIDGKPDEIITGIEPYYWKEEVNEGDKLIGARGVFVYPNQWSEEQQIEYIINNLKLAEVEEI